MYPVCPGMPVSSRRPQDARVRRATARRSDVPLKPRRSCSDTVPRECRPGVPSCGDLEGETRPPSALARPDRFGKDAPLTKAQRRLLEDRAVRAAMTRRGGYTKAEALITR